MNMYESTLSAMPDIMITALKAARDAKGLSQAELGRRVGKDQGYISRLERGRLTPQLATLNEIARALDLEIMLVPRERVPAVKAVVQPRSTQLRNRWAHLDISPDDMLRTKPAYRLDEDEDDG